MAKVDTDERNKHNPTQTDRSWIYKMHQICGEIAKNCQRKVDTSEMFKPTLANSPQLKIKLVVEKGHLQLATLDCTKKNLTNKH